MAGAVEPGGCAMISVERLRELLAYDPETGVFTWRTGPRAGMVAGGLKSYGYLAVWRCYKSHRLAWLYMTGDWPLTQIDHINRVRTDNRFDNLREATHAENVRNSGRRKDNASGFKGVSWHQRGKCWQVSIFKDGRRVHLGSYKTTEEASAAYAAAAQRMFGEFARVE
jgi:hypothetical protein